VNIGGTPGGIWGGASKKGQFLVKNDDVPANSAPWTLSPGAEKEQEKNRKPVHTRSFTRS